MPTDDLSDVEWRAVQISLPRNPKVSRKEVYRQLRKAMVGDAVSRKKRIVRVDWDEMHRPDVSELPGGEVRYVGPPKRIVSLSYRLSRKSDLARHYMSMPQSLGLIHKAWDAA